MTATSMVSPTVMLAERDGLVAVDLSDALESAGYRVSGAFGTMREAMELLDVAPPAFAIVNPVLGDGICTPLVAGLRKAGIPFLIHSGIERDDSRVAAFQGAPWLSKPAPASDVVETLKRLELSRPDVEPRPRIVEPLRSTPDAAASGNPFVRKLAGFVSLTGTEQAALDRISAHPRPVPAHTDLLREGSASAAVCLFMSGFACRYRQRINGARQITDYLLPGDTCDLDPSHLSRLDHTVATLSACSVVRIPKAAFEDLVARHPRIDLALRLSKRVDEAILREWLMNVGCRSALERIAHLLCEVAVRLRAVGLASEDACDLPITQNELADTTGMTTVHVNRSLQELRRRELIELKGRRLRILDWPRLKGMAEFRATYLNIGDRVVA